MLGFFYREQDLNYYAYYPRVTGILPIFVSLQPLPPSKSPTLAQPSFFRSRDFSNFFHGDLPLAGLSLSPFSPPLSWLSRYSSILPRWARVSSRIDRSYLQNCQKYGHSLDSLVLP